MHIAPTTADPPEKINNVLANNSRGFLCAVAIPPQNAIHQPSPHFTAGGVRRVQIQKELKYENSEV